VLKFGIDANLVGANLNAAYLSEANLIRAHLQEANLARADLSGADLTGAGLIRTNLTRANLVRAHLRGADLLEANLKEADLVEADLSRANLGKTNLRKADLRGAHLIDVDLVRADLQRSNLIDVNLTRANLDGADLNNSSFGWTVISGVNLSEVKGLRSINHEGPSSIGTDTVYLSEGKIPEIFLRGAGVPDNLIEYIPDLIEDAIQFYSCFISYSTKDQEFAERLHSDLQNKGVRCWFAPEDIKGGRKLHEQIPEAIRLYDKLLLVLSENSMNSEWVKTEIYHARQDEIRTGKRKLFPIGLIDFEEIRKWQAFDADVGKDMAREVREYYIPDFSAWKNHDSYRKALDRLVRDLQAEN
jgi:uncharacterized protein YjbI with pentapeptide repeats